MKSQSSAAPSAVGLLPQDWPMQRAKFHFKERQERSVEGAEELLSASHITGITKRSDKDVSMFLAESTEGYKIVSQGDAVVNTMWAWMGAMGISPVDGIISPSYGVYAPISNKIDGRYFDYLVRSKPFIAEVNRRSKGVWSSRLRLYPNEFLNMRLPIPARATQRSIADFLDRTTSHINLLLENKHLMLALIQEKWTALIHDARQAEDTEKLRFDTVANRIHRSVDRCDEQVYEPVGLLNRGRGIFHKEPTLGAHLGDSTFSWIESGDLIFSGQFAWEGAIALAGCDDARKIASHRYPIFRGNSAVNTAYLLAFFRTPVGQFILEENSRGAAGRNRPLNPNTLKKETIPLPSVQTQERIAALVTLERRLSDTVKKYSQILFEYKEALVTAAVTGCIDVTTWNKQSADEHFPDQIKDENPTREARA